MLKFLVYCNDNINMGKHGKYEKQYRKAWENLPEFKGKLKVLMYTILLMTRQFIGLPPISNPKNYKRYNWFINMGHY